jgi:hypothetical protein
MGSVFIEWFRVGDHYRLSGTVTFRALHVNMPTILTVPSQELEMKLSLVIGFQQTEKVSLLCS